MVLGANKWTANQDEDYLRAAGEETLTVTCDGISANAL